MNGCRMVADTAAGPTSTGPVMKAGCKRAVQSCLCEITSLSIAMKIDGRVSLTKHTSALVSSESSPQEIHKVRRLPGVSL